MIAFIWRYRELVYIVISLAAIWFLFQWGNSNRIRANENEKGMNAALLLLDQKELEITQYKNELGNAVTVIQNQELDRKNFEKIAKLERFNLEKSFNVKLRKIQSLTTFNTTSKVDSVMRDTVYLEKTQFANLRLFEYKDKYNDLRFYVNDSSRFVQTDSISGIDIRSRPDKWFWKFITFRKWRETSTYQLTNRNRLVQTNSVFKMSVAHKR